jgi:hypothetical protein
LWERAGPRIIAIDLAAKLRNRVPPLAWARLVAREEGPNRPGLLKDPSRNVPKLMAWAKQGWGVEIDEATGARALAEPV